MVNVVSFTNRKNKLPIFRASYIQESSNPGLMKVPGHSDKTARNNVNVMDNIHFIPVGCSQLSPYVFLETKVGGLGGPTVDPHSQFGTCTLMFTGKQMRIVQITLYDYNVFKNAIEKGLPDYTAADPYIFTYI